MLLPESDEEFWLHATTSNYQEDNSSFTPTTSLQHKQPYFSETEPDNMFQRVAVGRPVKFKCVVNRIGDHRLAWFHKDKRLLLALDNKTVVWKDRIHVSSQANSVFYLQIDSVQLSDKGQFSCQLNTQPIQSQVHILDVVKSPQIREQETTVNIEPVKEFGSVELRCVADGIPKPLIKWRRESQMHVIPVLEEGNQYSDGNEDGSGEETGYFVSSKESSQVASQPSSSSYDVSSNLGRRKQRQADSASAPSSSTFVNTLLSGNIQQESRISEPLETQTTNKTSTINPNKLFIAEGEVLRFDRISRNDMGFYMCIASNGIPPSVSQRIFLPVSYSAVKRMRTNQSNGRRNSNIIHNHHRQNKAAYLSGSSSSAHSTSGSPSSTTSSPGSSSLATISTSASSSASPATFHLLLCSSLLLLLL